MGVHVHVHVHAGSCVCTHMNLSQYVQMSTDVNTSGKTDEDDRCECIRAWVCLRRQEERGGGLGGYFACA